MRFKFPTKHTQGGKLIPGSTPIVLVAMTFGSSSMGLPRKELKNVNSLEIENC